MALMHLSQQKINRFGCSSKYAAGKPVAVAASF